LDLQPQLRAPRDFIASIRQKDPVVHLAITVLQVQLPKLSVLLDLTAQAFRPHPFHVIVDFTVRLEREIKSNVQQAIRALQMAFPAQPFVLLALTAASATQLQPPVPRDFTALLVPLCRKSALQARNAQHRRL